jgi:hypothetical protein
MLRAYRHGGVPGGTAVLWRQRLLRVLQREPGGMPGGERLLRNRMHRWRLLRLQPVLRQHEPVLWRPDDLPFR